jgi:hypothetical protein
MAVGIGAGATPGTDTPGAAGAAQGAQWRHHARLAAVAKL